MSVFQLCYVSTAAKGITDQDISDILKKAQGFNASQKIGGLLMFHSGVFLQLLEGEKNAVNDLYRKITVDQRHKSCYVLAKRQSEERMFPYWSMGYYKIEKIDLKLVNEILSWKKLVNNREVSEEDLLLLLASFKEKGRG